MARTDPPISETPAFTPCRVGDIATPETLGKLFAGDRAWFARRLRELNLQHNQPTTDEGSGDEAA